MYDDHLNADIEYTDVCFASCWVSLILLVGCVQWLKGTESPNFQELGPYVYDVSPRNITPCLIKGDPSQAACMPERMILALHPEV